MFQLLIVDDEIHAVRTIQSCVDWAELSITHIHVAYNIRQAKKIFDEHPIDMMICDIEMPQGSGIELLTWVREMHPASESLFLTCHSDFDYAKKAIALGSLDYLLKPVQFDELKNVVEKGLAKVAERKEQQASKESSQYYSKLWQTHRPIVMERFWEDLFLQRVSPYPDKIRELVATRNLPIRATDHFIPILICIHRWLNKLTPREEKIMEYALLNAAEHSILKGNEHRHFARIGADMLLIMLPVDEKIQFVEKDELIRICELYMSTCNNYFRCDLSCYVGEIGSVSELVKQFDGLLAMNKGNKNKCNKVFFSSDQHHSIKAMDVIQMDVWLEMLKRGAYDAILTETDLYLSSLMQVERLPADLLQRFLQSFLQILYHFIQSKDLQAYQVLGEVITTEQQSQAVRSVTDLQAWVRHALELTINGCCESDDTQSVMGKIKTFVKQHLDQAISREDIAKHVSLHPDYLSRWFKKESGKSIMEFIVEEKMTMAKELLATTEMSVSDIAIAVGYTNFSYFSKVFKHEIQMNPNQYRKTRGQKCITNRSV